jgi:hypothetical protein
MQDSVSSESTVLLDYTTASNFYGYKEFRWSSEEVLS